jgi:hypothetical protein
MFRLAMKTGGKYINMEREEALKKIKKLWIAKPNKCTRYPSPD